MCGDLITYLGIKFWAEKNFFITKIKGNIPKLFFPVRFLIIIHNDQYTMSNILSTANHLDHAKSNFTRKIKNILL